MNTTHGGNIKQVLDALRKTSKGQLTYDRTWKDEGRTQEIISEVKLQLSAIHVSPRSFNKSDTKDIIDNKQKTDHGKYKVTQCVNDESLNELNNICVKSVNDSKINDEITSLNSVKRNVSDIDILNYETERVKNVRDKTEERSKEINDFIQKTDDNLKEEINIITQRYSLLSLKKAQSFKEDYDSLSAELSQRHANLESQNNSHDTSTTHKLKEIESKHKLLIAEQEKKQREIRCKQLIQLKYDFDTILKEVMALAYALESQIKTNNMQQYVKSQQNELINVMHNIDDLLTKSNLNNDDVKNIENFKNIAINIPLKIKSEIENEKQKLLTQKERDIKTKHVQFNDPQLTHVNPISVHSETSSISSSVSSSSLPSSAPIDSLSPYVDPQAFKEYFELQQYANSFEKSFENLVNDVKLKRYKTDLQHFIKTTINTISSGSVEHLKDKLNRLSSLFNGKTITFQEKQINCNEHKEALNFCMSFAAKTFISVGTKQVVSVPKAAFTMAAVIVQLWSRFPNFGKIFLSQMQVKCPYIVPYYPKREKDDNDVTYLSACGYSVSSDGKISESEDAFLNRMRAMIRIYAAIVQSNLQGNHPQDINFAWMWIARVLNLEPRPAITSAILHAFLSVSSHKLYIMYQFQFIKLLRFIQFSYIPMIEKVSEKETKKQSLVQLAMFITEINKKLRRKPSSKEMTPEGVIPDYFWQNQYLFSRGMSS